MLSLTSEQAEQVTISCLESDVSRPSHLSCPAAAARLAAFPTDCGSESVPDVPDGEIMTTGRKILCEGEEGGMWSMSVGSAGTAV